MILGEKFDYKTLSRKRRKMVEAMFNDTYSKTTKAELGVSDNSFKKHIPLLIQAGIASLQHYDQLSYIPIVFKGEEVGFLILDVKDEDEDKGTSFLKDAVQAAELNVTVPHIPLIEFMFAYVYPNYRRKGLMLTALKYILCKHTPTAVIEVSQHDLSGYHLMEKAMQESGKYYANALHEVPRSSENSPFRKWVGAPKVEEDFLQELKDRLAAKKEHLLELQAELQNEDIMDNEERLREIQEELCNEKDRLQNK